MKARPSFANKWDELAHLADRGLLKAEEVVAFAKNKRTHLHGCFEWNDTSAAQKYRVQQARQQISMYVMVVQSPQGPVKVRALHSLPNDRRAGGGYRRTTDILKDDALVQELVASALKEFAEVRARYEVVQALSPVWDAVDRVARVHGGKAKKAA